MRNLACLICVLLAACATPQQRVPPPEFLFDDALFSAPSQQISADEVFALSDEMKEQWELKHPVAWFDRDLLPPVP